MQERKKPLRRPDGQPELRSLDEILAQAVQSEDFTSLPGRGRPIDLKDYFASGPEHRVAGRLLRDNQVLPQPLQERRDAEGLCQEAAAFLEREVRHLRDLRAHIEQEAAALSQPFPDRPTLLRVMGLEQWPAYLPEPEGRPLPPRRTFLQAGARLSQRLAAHDRRAEIALSRYMEFLGKANACIERLNTEVVFSRHLSPLLQARPVNLQEREAEARRQLPRLGTLPADLEERLRGYHRQAVPSLRKRLGF